MKRLLIPLLAALATVGALALWLVVHDVSPPRSAAPDSPPALHAPAPAPHPSREEPGADPARRLVAGDPGLATPLDAVPSPPPGDLEDTGAPVIFGVVTEDGTGSALDGALVELLGADRWLPKSRRQEAIAETRTDGGGAFRIPGPSRERRYQVRVSAERHASGIFTAVPGRRLDIALHPTRVVKGMVREAGSGEPIEGAEVFTHPAGITQSSAVSDERGAYRLENVVAGRDVVLFASHPDYAPARLELRIPPGGESTIDLELEAGRILEGRIVDARTRGPLPGGRIEDVRESVPAARADASGRFTLHLPWDRTWFLFGARAEGYCRSQFQIRENSRDGGEPLLVPLVPGAGIDGIVVDEVGLPVAGARVTVREKFSRTNRFPGDPAVEEILQEKQVPRIYLRSGPASRDVVSGEDGRFHVEELVPCDLPKHVRADHPDHAPARSGTVVLPVPATRTFVKLILAPACRVEGRVTIRGERAEGVVHWRVEDGRGGQVPVDGAGWYTTDALSPGEVSLFVVPKGRSGNSTLMSDPETSATLRLEPGERVRQDFALSYLTAPIAGRVRTPSGDPVARADVFVRASREGGAYTDHTTTDAQGRFRLQDLPADVSSYRMVVRRGSVRADVEEVSPGTEDLEVILDEEGRLRLRILDGVTGKAVRGVVLFLRDPGSPRFDHPIFAHNLHPDPSGVVETALLAGTYDVWVHAGTQGYLPELLTGVRVSGEAGGPDDAGEGVSSDAGEAGGRGPIVVRLRRGTRLEMRWTGPGGRVRLPPGHVGYLLREGERLPFEGPLPRGKGGNWSWHELALRFLGDEWDLYWRKQNLVDVDDRGIQVFPGLEPGGYGIVVVPSDVIVTPDRFTLSGPDPAVLEVSWREGSPP